MKKLLFAPFAALLVAFSANATSIHSLTLNQQPQDDGLKQLIEVQTHRNPGAIIATDALYGGLAGLAIGGGVALLNNDGNWGRDLAVGAGAGLLIGGIFGAVDAAASADRAIPVGEVRDVGFSRGLNPIGGKF
ncbi:MAG: hypothetical protein E6J88_13725 [Deltaproteobacteria bacterium]|nr:MAG: hypothetical protein E6J88_13725 [Deltaproteobacteria bacterium]